MVHEKLIARKLEEERGFEGRAGGPSLRGTKSMLRIDPNTLWVLDLGIEAHKVGQEKFGFGNLKVCWNGFLLDFL